MAHSLLPWYGGYIPWPFINAIFMKSSGLMWAISNMDISIHGWHLEYTKDPSITVIKMGSPSSCLPILD